MPFLFVDSKKLMIARESPNDCLTIAIATLRDLGFTNLKRGNDVSGTRAGAFVSVSCRPAPGDYSFWAFVASVGEDERAARSGRDMVISNL
jgi:hypothetical protein